MSLLSFIQKDINDNNGIKTITKLKFKILSKNKEPPPIPSPPIKDDINTDYIDDNIDENVDNDDLYEDRYEDIYDDDDIEDDAFCMDETPRVVINRKYAEEYEKTVFLPNPDELLGISKLSDRQSQAVRYIVEESHKNSIKQEYELFKRVKSNEDLQKLILYIRDEAPIIIHVHIATLCDIFMKDGFYRNLFETSTSRGTNCTSLREQWESRMFNRIYDGCASGSERVKYGTLNVLNDPYGISACYSYGDCYFKLKNVRLRTSFADCDTASNHAILSSCEHYCHVLMKYSDAEFNATLDVALNRQKYVNSKVITVYKEVQIHGDISLAENVESLVVNPSYKSDKNRVKQFTKLGEKYGFKIQWMDEL